MKPENTLNAGFRLPRLGARIIKTSIAVFICLMIYMLRGYNGMPSQSTIAAIVCMQPFVQDSKQYAVNRVTGTIIGAMIGLVFLLFLSRCHIIRYGMPVAFLIEALGVCLTFYLFVVLKKADSASLAAIVFLCVVISYPYIEDPILSARDRIVDTLIGTLVAIAVNVVHLPRGKNSNRLFFIRAKDLVPDRYSHIANSVLIGLTRLYNDGAKICIISEHAPAFFIPQMGTVKVNVPFIVMDGAAMYDMEEKEFCKVFEMDRPLVHNLKNLLEGMNVSYYVNAIRSNSLMIYHHGDYNQYEDLAYQDMKRSPYRNYVKGTYTDEDKIAFFKIVHNDAKIEELKKTLEGLLPESRVRMISRPHVGRENISALYIYSADATVENMKKEVLRRECGDEWLLPTEIYAKKEYHSERDGLFILNRIRDIYQPVSIKAFFQHLKPKKTKKAK